MVDVSGSCHAQWAMFLVLVVILIDIIPVSRLLLLIILSTVLLELSLL